MQITTRFSLGVSVLRCSRDLPDSKWLSIPCPTTPGSSFPVLHEVSLHDRPNLVATAGQVPPSSPADFRASGPRYPYCLKAAPATRLRSATRPPPGYLWVSTASPLPALVCYQSRCPRTVTEEVTDVNMQQGDLPISSFPSQLSWNDENIHHSTKSREHHRARCACSAACLPPPRPDP